MSNLYRIYSPDTKEFIVVADSRVTDGRIVITKTSSGVPEITWGQALEIMKEIKDYPQYAGFRPFELNEIVVMAKPFIGCDEIDDVVYFKIATFLSDKTEIIGSYHDVAGILREYSNCSKVYGYAIFGYKKHRELAEEFLTSQGIKFTIVGERRTALWSRDDHALLEMGSPVPFVVLTSDQIDAFVTEAEAESDALMLLYEPNEEYRG